MTYDASIRTILIVAAEHSRPTDYNLHEKNDTVFAWQLGVGASYPLSDTTKLFLDYRYFAADGANLKLEPGFHGGECQSRLRQPYRDGRCCASAGELSHST